MIHISTLSRVARAASCLRVGLHYSVIRLKGVKGLELRMPALSPTMSEGTIIKWLKKEGDPITAGDSLCEIQTDKAVMTFDIEEEGILAKILLPDDTKDVKIGTLIGLLVEEGQSWKDVQVPENGQPAVSTAPKVEVEETNQLDNSKPAKLHQSTMGPATKKLLLEYGLEQTAIVAGGPRGNLLKGDVLKYIRGKNLKPIPATKSAPPVSKPAVVQKKAQKTQSVTAAGVEQVFVDVPNSELQKTLAASAVRSKNTIPHSYCSVECEVDDVLRLCRTLQEDDATVRVSLDDFVIKAAAVALQRVPEVNAQLTGGIDEHVQLLTNVDIAIEDHNTDDVIIRDVIGLRVTEISERAEKLQAADHHHPPLTVSNLGSFGVTEFTQIVLEHQTAVLAVGTSRITIDEDGCPRSRLTATLSYDARVFNEEFAAKFLSEFASAIGNPALILVSLGPSSSAAVAASA